ncbi:class I SAM-dependent DNA methyltransferase [Flavobacterium marginilacus]|uniref:class I SAM-dependent DNA methyltransferase n=1 Tax=Flavobacterium marginilacus TaxID=3003256 RepID=UPI00248EF874|nr:class I SAM-dependent methyltransferase [Flavobacterium marginilacus]
MTNFQQYSKYYDLLYKDKNYREESHYVIEKIKSFAPNATQILELGSGSGSHANYFCEAGFEVTGIERSQEMTAIAKAKKIIGFNPVVGDISSYEVSSQFDAAISLFHVISYLTENEALINCFKTTNKQLNIGGIFIFDIWYSPAVYHLKPETRIKRLEDDEIEVVRLTESEMESDKNVVAVNFEVIIKDKITQVAETIKEEHLMRHFSIPEIKMLAVLTGFEVLQAEEFLTRNSPSQDTWGVCFVLKKNKL